MTRKIYCLKCVHLVLPEFKFLNIDSDSFWLGGLEHLALLFRFRAYTGCSGSSVSVALFNRYFFFFFLFFLPVLLQYGSTSVFKLVCPYDCLLLLILIARILWQRK